MSGKNMKLKAQSPSVRGNPQMIKKLWLTSFALASSIFCALPIPASATNLNAAADGQNSNNPAYPPDSYNFIAPNVDFTIIGNTGNTSLSVNNSAGYSIDNGAFANNNIFTTNNVSFKGLVTPTNPIAGITVSGNLTLNGSVLNATPVNLYKSAGITLNADNVNLTGPVNNLSKIGANGEIFILGNSNILGNVGSVAQPLAGIVAVNALHPVVQQTVTFGPNTSVNATSIASGFAPFVFADTLFNIEDNTTVNGNFLTAVNGTNLITLKTATINGNIGSQGLNFKSLTISPGKTANVNGNIYANNTIINNAGILRIGDNKSIFGLVDSTGGAATLEFLGNSSISYDIGIANKLSEINMIGPAGTTVNLSRDLAISATTVRVNNGGTLSLAPNITVGADGAWIISDGSIAFLGEGAVLNPNDFTLGPNSTLAFDMAGTTLLVGGVIADNQALLDPSATIEIVNPGFSPYHTSSSVAIRSAAVPFVAPPHPFVTNSLLTSVSSSYLNPLNKIDLVLDLSSLPSQQFADQGNTHGVAGVLDVIASGPSALLVGTTTQFQGPTTGSLQAIINQMGIFTDAQSLNNALATLSPIVDGAITYESFNTQNAIFGTVGDRMDRMNFWRIHALSEPQGVAAGDSVTLDQGAWVKVYHQHGRQKIRHDIAGYSDHSWGITVGGDTMITNHSLIGASFSWTALDVNHDVSGSKTNANSYQATMYSSVDFDCPLYVNAAVGVSYNNYITARNIVFNDLNIHPRGHYHGIQTGAKAEMGYVFGGLRYHAIPIASLYYSNLALRSYQETDAGNASQIIRRQDYDTLLVGAGGKLVDDYPMSDNYLLQSEAHAMMFYDLFDDNVQTTSQFVGAGPSFNTFGFKPARDSYNLGASLTLFSHYSFNMSAEYDFNFKQDYRANSGFVRVRYEFL